MTPRTLSPLSAIAGTQDFGMVEYEAQVVNRTEAAVAAVPEAIGAVVMALFRAFLGKGPVDARTLRDATRVLEIERCWDYVRHLAFEDGLTAFDAVAEAREQAERDLESPRTDLCAESFENPIGKARQDAQRAFLRATDDLTTRPRPRTETSGQA